MIQTHAGTFYRFIMEPAQKECQHKNGVLHKLLIRCLFDAQNDFAARTLLVNNVGVRLNRFLKG